MPMSSEPKEIAEARELLKEFEKSPGLSKKSCFSEAMDILNDFLNEHPDSEFSERADNLKKIYIELLVKRLGTIPFSNYGDWVNALAWVLKEFPEEERGKFETTPELKEHWHKFANFLVDNFPYLKINKSIPYPYKQEPLSDGEVNRITNAR